MNIKRFQKLRHEYLEKYLHCSLSWEMEFTFEQFLLLELEAYVALFHNLKAEEEEE